MALAWKRSKRQPLGERKVIDDADNEDDGSKQRQCGEEEGMKIENQHVLVVEDSYGDGLGALGGFGGVIHELNSSKKSVTILRKLRDVPSVGYARMKRTVKVVGVTFPL
ncbi:hypothetical protein Nepgr_000083 [Nepenthes gracilis]|uniref:Uncharacterized protein n=1 Tax=Nepenthes gracilis TaxID=150966 RepID=A0AAD3P2J3_NEPGR|nr:hypothetical protein Nepgr_000083 [Nepenthes gracilis]